MIGVFSGIYFNGVKVKSVKRHKHLGSILDSKLTFASHINEKISKARKGIGIIKPLSRFLSIKTLDLIFKMYVRPHLDFCDVIYNLPCITNPFDSSINLSYLMNTLERIQYHAALAITGEWKGTNLNKVYEELGWESLSKRRWFQRMTMFYKITIGIAPAYLTKHVPITNPSNISLRRTVTTVLFSRTERYNNSFFPFCVKNWNLLDDSITSSPSLN